MTLSQTEPGADAEARARRTDIIDGPMRSLQGRPGSAGVLGCVGESTGASVWLLAGGWGCSGAGWLS